MIFIFEHQQSILIKHTLSANLNQFIRSSEGKAMILNVNHSPSCIEQINLCYCFLVTQCSFKKIARQWLGLVPMVSILDAFSLYVRVINQERSYSHDRLQGNVEKGSSQHKTRSARGRKLDAFRYHHSGDKSTIRMLLLISNHMYIRIDSTFREVNISTL